MPTDEPSGDQKIVFVPSRPYRERPLNKPTEASAYWACLGAVSGSVPCLCGSCPRGGLTKPCISHHTAVTRVGMAGMQRLTGPCPGARLTPLQRPHWGTEFSAVTEVTLSCICWDPRMDFFPQCRDQYLFYVNSMPPHRPQPLSLIVLKSVSEGAGEDIFHQSPGRSQ